MRALNPEQKIRYASLALRLGLAFVFLYAAISALRSPAIWLGYVPTAIADQFDAKSVLDLMSVVQIILAVWLVVGKWARYAGLVALVLLLGIIVPNIASFTITFRDVGLVLAAAAVVLLDWPTPEKH